MMIMMLMTLMLMMIMTINILANDPSQLSYFSGSTVAHPPRLTFGAKNLPTLAAVAPVDTPRLP
jgi:hypothetical protein